MIATHNIKVNGRWIHPGEEYEEEKAVKAEGTAKKVEKPAESTPKAAPEKETQKPKTSTRRKTIK